MDKLIDRHRRQLIKLASIYGLGHPRVLAQSQLLDKLIYQEQRRRLIV